ARSPAGGPEGDGRQDGDARRWSAAVLCRRLAARGPCSSGEGVDRGCPPLLRRKRLGLERRRDRIRYEWLRDEPDPRSGGHLERASQGRNRRAGVRNKRPASSDRLSAPKPENHWLLAISLFHGGALLT